jgi:hypothetical protein
MQEFIESISNREWAALIWLGAFVAAAMLKKEIRGALKGVIVALLNPKLVTAFVLGAIWAAVEILAIKEIGWWDIENLKTSLIWLVTFAFVGMFEVGQIRNNHAGLASITRDIINVTGILLFITELHSFPLVMELVALPIVTIFALAAEFSKHKPEFRKASGLLTAIVGMIGLFYLSFSIWMTIENLEGSFSLDNLREFGIPILLSFGFLPFLYLFRAYVIYETAFASISVFGLEKSLVGYARWLAFTRVGTNLELLRRWQKAIQLQKPKTKTHLKYALTQLIDLKKRESAPPIIEPQDGWSPYLAKDYMKDIDLPTGYYNTIDSEEWFASSTAKEIGDDPIFKNNIAYYIYGTETAATKLKIKLNINALEERAQAERVFSKHCQHLLDQAVSHAAVQRMHDQITSPQRFSADIPFGKVTLSSEEWPNGRGFSRTFEVCRGAEPK